MGRQIPLSFPVNESYAGGDFLTLPCNQEAMAWIDRYPDWPYPVLIIYGENGCGKTHLLRLWQTKAQKGDVAIDDAHDLFGDQKLEQDLFHQFNQVKENQTRLLMTMTSNVASQNILLPDLASRLMAAPQIEIASPDETDLRAILVKLFHDRQINVEPGVIAYIVPRIERSFSAARQLVQKIDESALAEKRSVTVPLVSAILKEPQFDLD
jgi:chromosomal replication initiation ATPase DnaA